MSGKSNELVQTKKHVAKLQAVIRLQSNRETAMAHAARTFRELIRRYGRHLPACRGIEHTEECKARTDPGPCKCCSCGWVGVEDFMRDDANFSRIAVVKR